MIIWLKNHWPRERTLLKVLHVLIIPLFVWFFIVQPKDIRPIGDWAFQMHSVFGLIFVSAALLWTGLYLRRGLVGRPGPKLKGWQRRAHPIMHKTLIWGIFLVALTGFGLGLTSSVLLWAGGIIPIAPPLGLPDWNDLIGAFHSLEFYLLGAIVAFHAGFHIWRHIVLGDNALRIMAPKRFHKYL